MVSDVYLTNRAAALTDTAVARMVRALRASTNSAGLSSRVDTLVSAVEGDRSASSRSSWAVAPGRAQMNAAIFGLT